MIKAVINQKKKERRNNSLGTWNMSPTATREDDDDADFN